MDDGVDKVPILRITEKGRSNIEDMIATEFPLTLILNKQELVTLLSFVRGKKINAYINDWRIIPDESGR